jgi:hypothetical protein
MIPLDNASSAPPILAAASSAVPTTMTEPPLSNVICTSPPVVGSTLHTFSGLT